MYDCNFSQVPMVTENFVPENAFSTNFGFKLYINKSIDFYLKNVKKLKFWGLYFFVN